MDEPHDNRLAIHTSEPGWLARLATIYKKKTPAIIIDDAKLGISPDTQTLVDMAKRSRLSKAEITGVCVALGMSAAGVALIVAAILDPEPTSKLGLLIAGGTVCILTGGLTAIRILTNLKPPRVIVRPGGIEIDWT